MGSGSLIKHMVTRSGILFLVKLLGVAARIPLFRVLGPEGIGLYQMAYAFYGFGLTMVTGGIPTSLALVTAENRLRGLRLSKRLAVLFLFVGLGTGWFSYQFSDILARLLGNEQLGFPIRCIAPAISIVPLLALIRGYLQGTDSHSLIAFSELIEQAIRLTFMMLLVFAWLPLGISQAVGGAMIGAFAGAIGAIVFLLVSTRLLSSASDHKWLKQSKPSNQVNMNRDLALFLYSSLTVSATRFIVPLSDFLDAYIVPNRLQAAGYSLTEAVSIFGELVGMGALIVYMPTLLTSTLAYTLATKLVADRVSLRKFVLRSELALRFGVLWGCASAFFLYTHAEPLAVLFFHDVSVAKAVRYLSLIPVISGLRELSTVILWAQGNKLVPLQGLILAVIGSLICNFTLTAIPGFGYTGVVIGILVLESIAALWNIVILKKAYKVSFPLVQTLYESAKLLIWMLIAGYAFRLFEMLFYSENARNIVQMTAVFSAGIGYLAWKVRAIRKQA